MEYRLLAVDMDDTALNREKKITPRTVEAIRRALAQRKNVVFATGRCLSELRDYLVDFPQMRYALLHSGGTVMELQTGRTLFSAALPPETVEAVEQLGRRFDATMVYYVGTELYLDRAVFDRLDHFSCGQLAPLYRRCARWEDVPGTAFRAAPDRTAKVNLFFHAHEEWRQAVELLRARGESVATGSPQNCEITPRGIDKGFGLRKLCEAVGVPISQTVAVGDSENDLAMLRAAGWSVAMGNAIDEVKAAADATVADCDHDGVAEAIARFLENPTGGTQR